MAEEHRCEPPEGHRLCANNCGFIGSAAMMNLCSKCYGDLHLKQQQQVSIKAGAAVSSSSSSTVAVLQPAADPAPAPPQPSLPEPAAEPPRQQQANRCTVCRKRVGLTGFRCRCGIVFCGTHRYPENHGCVFDFKKVGREEIARANPVVKASKLNNKI